MIVETAKHNEITKVVKYARHAHESSNWSWAVFSPSKFRKNLRRLLSGREYTVLLAKEDGEICGILIGMLDDMLQSNTTYAVDLEFFADKGGTELLERFRKWAKDNGAKAVLMADSNGGRTEAKDRFYRSKGFEYTGGVYAMKVEP